MSSIKPKKGNCCDCAEPKEVYLTAGRCQFHYAKYRQQVGKERRIARGIDANAYQDKRDLDNWFHFQISNMPKCCENCGEPLNQFAPWAARSFVAHIVRKKTVPSVKMHVVNRLFLCLICHTNYDNWGSDKIVQMKCYPLAVERFALFMGKISDDEWKHVPTHLIDSAYEHINKD
jgi:hypothetical protein